MSVFSSLKFILTHPINRGKKVSALARFISWQISCRLFPFPFLFPFTDKAKLIIGKGMTGATGNLYCGLHEYEDMFFLLHFLRSEDLFVDVGANVGSYTVLASAHINAHVVAFEPNLLAYNNLMNNINVNAVREKVLAYNMAVGSASGTVCFTKNLDTTNHVASENEKDDIIEVKIGTLDLILESQIPTLLKIDVEGFEAEVIKGAERILSNDLLKAIIIELNGSGDRYGVNENNIRSYFERLGFSSYSYDPMERMLLNNHDPKRPNSIYIRDFDFVKKRIEAAPAVKIFDKVI